MTPFFRSLILAAASTSLFMTAATAVARDRDTPDVQLQKLLAGRQAGRPVNCLNQASLGSSTIIEGRGILYRRGATIYLNVPRTGARDLDDDDILVTRSSGSQLCSGDSVNLVSRASRFQHGFVILGEFVPYTRMKGGR
jgi:hypothetical protein